MSTLNRLLHKTIFYHLPRSSLFLCLLVVWLYKYRTIMFKKTSRSVLVCSMPHYVQSHFFTKRMIFFGIRALLIWSIYGKLLIISEVDKITFYLLQLLIFFLKKFCERKSHYQKQTGDSQKWGRPHGGIIYWHPRA